MPEEALEYLSLETDTPDLPEGSSDQSDAYKTLF